MYRNSQTGFTLIEVMVVVAIVGILAAIAYPSYQNIVRQSNRSDAYNALMDAMGREERYFTDNNSYTSDLTKLGNAKDPYLSQNGYYLVSAAACGSGIAACVVISATGQKGQDQDMAGAISCATLSLDSTGAKSPTDCWKK